ncbi:MAG: hypothetical protein RL621_534 [Bacteroidota bacterium]|jgi:hypothetical protein
MYNTLTMKAITPIDLGRIDGIPPNTGGEWRNVWIGNYKVAKRNKPGAPEDANKIEFDTYKKASTELKKFLAHTELSGEILFQEKLRTDFDGKIQAIEKCFPRYYQQFSSIHGWDQLSHEEQFVYLWYPALMVMVLSKHQLNKNGCINNSVLSTQIQNSLKEFPELRIVFDNIKVLKMAEFKALLELDLYVLQDLHEGNLGYDDSLQLKILDMGGGLTHPYLKSTI